MNNHNASWLSAVYLPVSGNPSQAPAAGGFAVSPTPRAGTTFSPCRSYQWSCTTYCVRQPTTRSQNWESEPIWPTAPSRDTRNRFRSLPPALSAR